MTVEERAGELMKTHFSQARLKDTNDFWSDCELVGFAVKFAEAERRATITACLKQLEEK